MSTAIHNSDSIQNNNVQPSLLAAVPATATQVHLIVLVHGWMGVPEELSVLANEIRMAADPIERKDQSISFVVHSAKANLGRTYDGIGPGGRRLAQEINSVIRNILEAPPRRPDRNVSLSLVGHSLGGLYARYAVSEIDAIHDDHEDDHNNNNYQYTTTSQDDVESRQQQQRQQQPPPWDFGSRRQVRPMLFCTTATPHLGVSQHTYLPIPRVLEYVIANSMQPTGRDLFRFTNIIDQLALDPVFVQPLKRFHRRIAYATIYGTDFQVPTATAAFLSNTNSLHRKRTSNPDGNTDPFVVLVVDTVPQNEMPVTNSDVTSTGSSSTLDDVAVRLDAMGWTKVFCDVRNCLPFKIPIPGAAEQSMVNDIEDRDQYTSAQLLLRYCRIPNNYWHVPLGHLVLVANAKNAQYAKLSAGGQPIMQQLAVEMVYEIVAS